LTVNNYFRAVVLEVSSSLYSYGYTMWQPGLLCRTFRDLHSFALCFVHTNALLGPGTYSPKQWVNWFTYTTWGLPLPSWNLTATLSSFNRGFARGATSGLSWALAPQLA